MHGRGRLRAPDSAAAARILWRAWPPALGKPRPRNASLGLEADIAKTIKCVEVAAPNFQVFPVSSTEHSFRSGLSEEQYSTEENMIKYLAAALLTTALLTGAASAQTS